jgi:hypothetical protein
MPIDQCLVTIAIIALILIMKASVLANTGTSRERTLRVLWLFKKKEHILPEVCSQVKKRGCIYSKLSTKVYVRRLLFYSWHINLYIPEAE